MLAVGDYPARAIRSTLYENQKGSLIAAIELAVADNGAEVSKTFFLTLATADNGVSLKAVARGRACFPAWDGQDPTWFDGENVAGQDLSVTIEHAPDREDPSKMWDNAAWINPPGGRVSQLPTSGDKRTIVAKWGAKFRAAAGGAPVTSKPGPKPAAPTMPKTPPTRPNPAPAATSDSEACWAALAAANPGKDEQDLSETWFLELEKSAPGKQSADITPAEWGKVLASIQGTALPY